MPNKYDIYRVPLQDILSKIRLNYENAQLCMSFISNDINASSLIRLMEFKDEFLEQIGYLFSDILLTENFSTEQFCYFYAALWAISRIDYYDHTEIDPVSLLLDMEFMEELIHAVFVESTLAGIVENDKYKELIENYPLSYTPRSLSTYAYLFLFSDLWSRATSQVMPLELLLMLT